MHYADVLIEVAVDARPGHYASPDDAFTIGLAAELRDNLEVAVRASEQAATAGHTGAAFNLGFLLADRWEPPDLPAARRWYEQAVTVGDTRAMTNLGFLLADRWEPPDLPAARRWYEQAGLSP